MTWPPTGWGSTPTGSRHCPAATWWSTRAASVSFDSPSRRRRRGQPPRLDPGCRGHRSQARELALGRRPARTGGHHLPVSTAYVASTHQGEAKEELLEANPFSIDVDWRQRGRRGPAPTRRHRGRVPPTRAAGGVPQGGHARSSAAAGLHLLAERAERLREDWVKKQMVGIGQALGALLRGFPIAPAARLHPSRTAEAYRGSASFLRATSPGVAARQRRAAVSGGRSRLWRFSLGTQVAIRVALPVGRRRKR